MFIWTFLLRITHTIISQSVADSSWIILYIYHDALFRECTECHDLYKFLLGTMLRELSATAKHVSLDGCIKESNQESSRSKAFQTFMRNSYVTIEKWIWPVWFVHPHCTNLPMRSKALCEKKNGITLRVKQWKTAACCGQSFLSGVEEIRCTLCVLPVAMRNVKSDLLRRPLINTPVYQINSQQWNSNIVSLSRSQ